MNTKTTAMITGGGLAAVLVALVAVINSVDLNTYKNDISAQVNAATGRILTLAGDIKLNIGWNTSLSVNDVSFSNAAWGSRKNMLEASAIEAEVSLLALLGGNIEIGRIILDKPTLWLETDNKGNGNWVITNKQAKEKTKSDSSAAIPTIKNVRVQNGSFNYRDGKSKTVQTLQLNRLEANADNFDSPLSLSLEAKLNNKPIKLSGTIDTLKQLTASESTQIDLEALYDKWDTRLAGQLTFNEQVFHAQALTLTVNSNQISGNLSGTLGDTTNLKGEVSFNTVDLRKFPKVKAPEKASTDKIFSSDAIDVAGLRRSNIDLTIKGKQLLDDAISLRNIHTHITLNQGVLLAQPKLEIGGGTLAGEIALNATKKTPTLTASIEGSGLNLGNMIGETGAKDLIQQVNSKLKLKLSANGKTPAALAGNLSGRVLVDIGKGKINNKINLVGGDLISELLSSLNPVAKKEAFTHLECAVVNLHFRKGVADYDKQIAAMTDKMVIVSSGKIDLKQEQLDIGFSPKPRKDTADLGINAGELISAAKLTGPLSKPALGLDAANTALAGAKIYRAIASGGTSLLVDGLISKITADSNPCKTAREATPKKTSNNPASAVKNFLGF